MEKKKLILGLGNPLVGDEGVGIEVIQTLLKSKIPEDIDIADGGTGGIKLVHLLEGRDYVIIIDCADFGGFAGEVRVFSPEDIVKQDEQILSLHHLDLKGALSLAETIGIKPKITIIGIQPETIEFRRRLSKTVKNAIPNVIETLKNLLD